MRPAGIGVARRPIAWALVAIALLAAALAAWRQWPLQFLRTGETALGERRYDLAREQLAKYLAYRPNDAQAHLLAARAARNLGEYYDALEHLRLCQAAGGDPAAIEVETALIAVMRGEEPSPILRQQAEGDDESSLEILEVLIQYDIDHYRLRHALQELTRYLNVRPDDLQARLARGFVWERFLSFSDAMEDYRQAVESHPQNEEARLRLAQTALIAGTPHEALTHFQWLQERHPDQPEVLLGLARCHRLLGEAEEASRLLTALVDKAPESGEALWELGQLELDRGEAAKAEPLLRKAVAASPHDRRIAFSLSRCLLALGKQAEAEALNDRVAKIDADLKRLEQLRQEVMEHPQDATLRTEGGLIFLRNGERQEGLRWLRQAVRLDPQNQSAQEALASALEKSP